MQLFDRLLTSVQSGAAAVRLRTVLEPIGGPGDKVMPVTYAEAKYAAEERANEKGELVKTVLLDSVQSQANRMEEALADACRRAEIELPLFSVTIPNHGTLTTLEVPHRIHDAIFRDCLLEGLAFGKSELGTKIKAARATNATELLRHAPTALLFGTWDSQSEGGVTSAKIARAVVSEIVARGAEIGKKTSSRIDPLGIRLMKGIIYKHPDDMWTLDPEKKGVPLYGKKADAGKPSVINHGNVTPTIDPGGLSFADALQTTVLSLAQLRRLSFPVDGKPASAERDDAGRAVLAALGLFAIAALRENGYQLRSRCQLLPKKRAMYEFIGKTVEDRIEVDFSRDDARSAYQAARSYASQYGLDLRAGTIELTPSDKLLKLVAKSDAAGDVEEG